MATSGNLLNAQDEDFESAGVGNWVVGANCALANSATKHNTGANSLRVTSSAAGLTYPNSIGITCVAGEIIRVSTAVASASITANCNPLNVNFFSAGHTYNSTGNNLTVALKTTMTVYTTTYTVPATCITCELVPSWTAVGASEVVYWDTMIVSRPQLTPRSGRANMAVRHRHHFI